jgi:type I restriction enzyme S subunit
LCHALAIALKRVEYRTPFATVKHLSSQELKEETVPLPDLLEQQRIAEQLEQADRLCRTRRYALELTDTFLPAAFLELFGDPVRNAKGWLVSELEELATVERGKFTPRPRNDPSYYSGRFPFIQTGDISTSEGRLRSWTQTLNEKGVKVSRRFPPGTVVIAIVGATIGMTAILEVDVYCPDSVVGIQVNPEAATKEYIEFLLRFWRPVFLAQAPETARANINLDTLRPLRIPVPPLPLQQKFAALVERVERLRAVQREALRQAEHLFQTLLHRAFQETGIAQTP